MMKSTSWREGHEKTLGEAVGETEAVGDVVGLFVGWTVERERQKVRVSTKSSNYVEREQTFIYLSELPSATLMG